MMPVAKSDAANAPFFFIANTPFTLCRTVTIIPFAHIVKRNFRLTMCKRWNEFSDDN